MFLCIFSRTAGANIYIFHKFSVFLYVFIPIHITFIFFILFIFFIYFILVNFIQKSYNERKYYFYVRSFIWISVN